MQHLRQVHRRFVARHRSCNVTAMLPLRPLARGGSSLATGWGPLWMLKPDCLAVRTHSPISAVEQGTTNLPDLEPECIRGFFSCFILCNWFCEEAAEHPEHTEAAREAIDSFSVQFQSVSAVETLEKCIVARGGRKEFGVLETK